MTEKMSPTTSYPTTAIQEDNSLRQAMFSIGIRERSVGPIVAGNLGVS